ncbi:hypothetical protein ACIGHF_09640 [Stenotrophomonas sp. NPDC077464]|uniref:hypothetical protein n=1 Tax=unclassified Stenotrophomonas TaxID=196198 RepID=UPI0037D851F1
MQGTPEDDGMARIHHSEILLQCGTGGLPAGDIETDKHADPATRLTTTASAI